MGMTWKMSCALGGYAPRTIGRDRDYVQCQSQLNQSATPEREEGGTHSNADMPAPNSLRLDSSGYSRQLSSGGIGTMGSDKLTPSSIDSPSCSLA